VDAQFLGEQETSFMKSFQTRTLSAVTACSHPGQPALSACVPLLMGGAVVGTALVATDRRTSGAQLEDEGIELRASQPLARALGDRAHINVTSYNRQVLITGEVPSEEVRTAGGQITCRGSKTCVRSSMSLRCWAIRR
jgi:osmotically-inducible protein OsmY